MAPVGEDFREGMFNAEHATLLRATILALNEAPQAAQPETWQAAQPGGVEAQAGSRETAGRRAVAAAKRVVRKVESARSSKGHIISLHIDDADRIARAILTTPPKGDVPAFEDGALREADKDFAALLKDYNRAARLIELMRERWAAVLDQLNYVEGGMAADLEDAASKMAFVCDDPLAALSPDPHAQGESE